MMYKKMCDKRQDIFLCVFSRHETGVYTDKHSTEQIAEKYVHCILKNSRFNPK